jgi:sec-independent protein translocase protein TatC
VKLPFSGSHDPDPEPEPGEMTLVGHLTELRKRLIRSALAVFVGALLVYIFRERVYEALQEPYCAFQNDADRECEFLITKPLEAFSVMLTMSGYGGLLLATPVILYQIGKFVLPGLYPHEKKALLPFTALSVVLLFMGMAVAYLLMPKALEVLVGFGVDSFTPLFSPLEYLGFFMKMLFAFGIAAELPLVLIFLQKIGVVKTETLAKNRRIAVVAVVILGAVITPTGDPFMLLVISVPMYLFYEISIVIGKRIKKDDGKASASVGV